MNYNTFINIWYKHRLKKAKKIRYILLKIFLPIIYLINKLFDQKKINLDNLAKKNSYLFKKDLNFLFEFFSSDKGKKFKNQYQKPIKRNNLKILGHEYHKYYEEYFAPFKEKKINILEIGAYRGNASAAFYFYFPKAQIYSYDIFPDLFCYKSLRNFNSFLDNSSEKILGEKIINNNDSYDIIIEDAGHYYKDQIITLFKTFPKLNSGGVYVVEELDFPDTRKDMNIKEEHPTLREILCEINKGNNFISNLVSEVEKDYFLKNFEKIRIYKGRINEISFIKKK